MLLCKWQYEDDRVSSEIMKKYHLCILHIGIILLLIEQLYYIRLSRFISNTERVTHFGFTRFIYIFSHTSIYIYFFYGINSKGQETPFKFTSHS